MGPEKLWRRRNPVEDQPGSVEPEDAGVDKVRRGLMQVLLGGAAAVALSETAAAETISPNIVRTEAIRPPQSPEQAFRAAKQRILDDSIVATKNAIASRDVQDALRGRGRNQLSRILRAIELPILRAHLDDTTYDVSEVLRKYPVQLIKKFTLNEGKTAITKSESKVSRANEKHTRASERGPQEALRIGNGFYFGDANTFVTNEHLAKDFPESAQSIRNDSLDISVAAVEGFLTAVSPDQIVYDDPAVTDADIEGGLVAIVGTDPDPLADMNGKKAYPGIAVKLTPEFAQGILGEPKPTATDDEKKKLEWYKAVVGRSYMIVLPPGEGRKMFPKDEGEVPAQGMSGSGVYKYINGKQRLVGIFWAADSLPDRSRGRNVDVAYFLPISAIREVVKNTKRWQLK